jgi:uncharacterized membrane protein
MVEPGSRRAANVLKLASDKTITVEEMVLVSRDADGKIHEKDNADSVGKGTAWGVAGGLLLGAIFPPSLLARAAVGAGVGAGVGGLVSHHEKKEIKAEVANDLPVGSSGIVVLFDETWVTEIEKSFPKADNVSKHTVDKQSVSTLRTKRRRRPRRASHSCQPLPPAPRDPPPHPWLACCAEVVANNTAPPRKNATM